MMIEESHVEKYSSCLFMIGAMQGVKTPGLGGSSVELVLLGD